MEEKILTFLKEKIEELNFEIVFKESSPGKDICYIMKDFDILFSFYCNFTVDGMSFTFYSNEDSDKKFVGFLQSEYLKYIKVTYDKNLKKKLDEVINFINEKLNHEKRENVSQKILEFDNIKSDFEENSRCA